jgi:hypothetical protein
MRELVPINKEIDVITIFYRPSIDFKNYKEIKIICIFYQAKWIRIIETKRVWRVKTGQFYDYFFIVYNLKNTSFSIVYHAETLIWELISYEYES